MELRRFWLLIWQRKFLVALLLVAAVSAGYLTTPQKTDYSATATLFVGVPLASADQQIGQQYVAATFATMVPGYAVAQQALESASLPLSVGKLVSETKASVVFGTTLIHVTVTDADPAVAQQGANAMAAAFVAQIRSIYGASQSTTTPNNASGNAQSVTVSLSQPALFPVVPNSTGLTRNLALSALFGLVVAIALVMVLNYLDLAVRTPDALEERLSLPVIGVIPRFPRLETTPAVLPDVRVGRAKGKEPAHSGHREQNGASVATQSPAGETSG